MKNILIALIAAAAPFGLAQTTDAGQHYYPAPKHCAPKVYKTHTCEVHRCYQYRTAYNHCGKRYTFRVAVITYKDYYSNGTFRTYTRTVRA